MREKTCKLIKFTALAVMMLIVVVCSNPKGINARTTVGRVENLAQQGIDKNTISVTWSPAENATSYSVYYRLATDYNSEYTLSGTAAQNSYTVTGLLSGEMYSIKVFPVGAEGSAEYNYDTVSAVTLLDKLKGLKQSKWWYYIKSLDVTWEAGSAVEGCEVVLYDDKNKKVKQNVVKNYNSTSFNKMKDKVYTVKARAFMTYQGQKYYTPWASIKCLNQARVTSVKVSGSKLNIKWGKISGATGYNIYVSTTTKAKDFKKVGTVKSKSNSYSVKNLKGKKFSAKKRYYVYVESVCNTKSSKNTSGALYYWDSKTNREGYIK